jgi:hypothetical protein
METKYIWDYENETPVEVKGEWVDYPILPAFFDKTEKMFHVTEAPEELDFIGHYYDDEIYSSVDVAILARKNELNLRLLETTNLVAAFYEKYPNA